jgi:hypothetical protein
VPAIEDREKLECRVIRQISEPKRESVRNRYYPHVQSFKMKKEAIAHLNEMGIKNAYRPKGYKTYDMH